RRDPLGLGFELAHQLPGDRRVDLRLRAEEPVNIGRGHAQLARDVGDRGLLKSNSPEKPFGGFDDRLPLVLLLMHIFLAPSLGRVNAPVAKSLDTVETLYWRWPVKALILRSRSCGARQPERPPFR